jgi:dynein heavy chain
MIRPPESTQEMINLGEYMLNVKNKVMNTLKEEIECSKGHLLYLIDVHIFSKEDINLNTTTLAWPQKIKPVFEQNTELVEDCKARFEERLQGKSENITKELLKLNGRVKELEDLGEMKNIQQYTYEVRLVNLQYAWKSLAIFDTPSPLLLIRCMMYDDSMCKNMKK